MARLNLLEETRFEKLPVTVYHNQYEASLVVAQRIAKLITSNNTTHKLTILGLATGASPVRVYEELIRLYKQEGLSFKNVITFNLDEYFPMLPNAAQSYVRFMHEKLFNHIDIHPNNIHIPNGNIPAEEVAEFCMDYEKKIAEYGGIDLQLLGIGRTGHIGFNEPGSAPNSGTRLVTLDNLTRKDAAKDFNGKENVPKKAITMGIGSIFKAKEILLLAWGDKKADIIKKAVETDINANVPATFLQLSNQVEFILDEAAASSLTRFNTPWLVKDCDWTTALQKKAVIWLAQKLQKPILKLTEEDYNLYGLPQLLFNSNSVSKINIDVFNALQYSITGWPGGKPNADDTQRPERALPAKKKVLIFSPHPDDDVISMGATFIKLVKQGHEVHVAYQTSGNNAVWNEDVLRFLEFSIELNKTLSSDNATLIHQYEEIKNFIAQPHTFDTEPTLLKHFKGLIRKGEALAGARFCGLPDEHIHFMKMPFYEKRKSSKDNVLEYDDINITKDLINKIKPHQIFVAGDFADPHGTHKVCFDCVKDALIELKQQQNWVKDCWLWMYRGAWHEWQTHEIEMAVPLSPKEVLEKRKAIFKHQSQKDTPVFPGDDAREFWVRAEERNKNTANQYNLLGLPEYEGMEAFVRYHF